MLFQLIPPLKSLPLISGGFRGMFIEGRGRRAEGRGRRAEGGRSLYGINSITRYCKKGTGERRPK